jgi:uncharacterized protein
VEFEWDERKNRENISKHGFSFVIAEKFFSGRIFQRIDDRRDYGEERLIALGEVEGTTLNVVFTIRNKDVYRIISIRRARKDEERAYRALQEKHERRD